MNFVNTIIPKSEYKDFDKFGTLTVVHLDPVEDDDNINCVETIVEEYNKDEVTKAYNEWKDKVATNELKLAKINKIAEISKYDTSDNVNSFSINGVSMWLNRNDRNALMRRFEAEKESGITNTSLWYGTNKFDLTVDNAIEMLNKIEVYACSCYDITALHKSQVDKLTNIDEIDNFDITKEYPSKISLSTI